MKTSNLLFSGPMVRAILERRKTKTRRPVDPPPPAECSIHYMLGAESWLEEKERSPVRHTWEAWHGPAYRDRPAGWLCGQHSVRSPVNGVGDRIRVRENYRFGRGYDGVKPREVPPFARIHYEADGPAPDWAGALRPSIFLPGWASRVSLVVTSLGVERLQEITDAEAILEGIVDARTEENKRTLYADEPLSSQLPHLAFAELWDGLNEARGFSWRSNPYVWSIGFELLES